MNKLLIDDYPILVLPKLAEQIGLNEAIVLQQMHYWLSNSNHFYDGRKWIYNSYKSWEEQFPFWSNVTIRRTISSLEKQNLLYVGNYNKAGFDKTKWYSIDYEGLEGMSKRVAQNEQTMWSKRANGVAQSEQVDMVKMSKPIPETNTEIISETSTNNNSATDVTRERFEEWWKLYDKKLDKKKAFSLFKSALKEHSYETIMNGTREYLKTITNKQYQKYPKTFLSQESYLNDFTEEAQPTGQDQLERMKHDPSYWD
ncbi:conserved phage C-terminal domain-containing protein [Staphylococcus pseudoxylosus]